LDQNDRSPLGLPQHLFQEGLIGDGVELVGLTLVEKLTREKFLILMDFVVMV
jgi:hypothetical protein